MSSSSSSTTTTPLPTTADKKEIKRVYAYAHGFLSDENSYKGRFFRDYLSTKQVKLHLLNLNPQDAEGKTDYASITYTGALQAIQNLYEAEGGAQANVKLTLFGSSLGGYVAARYAELHPDAVEKMVLFCPGFNLQGRWPTLFGEEGMKAWKEKGTREFEVKGQKVQVPYGFLEDGHRHPPFPKFVQPALVVHGLRDETVPVETTTEELLGQGDGVKELVHVLLVDDDHGLTKEKTLAVASKCILEFLDIREGHKGEEKETEKLAASDHIEVEQKFSVQDRTTLENKVLAAGAELKGAVIFTGAYLACRYNVCVLIHVMSVSSSH
jgi:pimeloyl-ACP methyl ester carboxylesterase